MANEFTWDLEEIRDEWRRLTGLSQTADIADAIINAYINDYYANYFPEDALLDEREEFLTQALSPTDDGGYSLAQTVMKIMEPMTVNGNPILLYKNAQLFFETYLENEQYITAPELAIGSSSKAAVANSAFSYAIAGQAYSKAAAETALSGGDIPEGKYGAWLLYINAAGTISVREATLNAGDTVIGSDLNEYRCKVSHTSGSATRPITGANYSSYWELTGSTGSAETWVTATAYSATGTGYNNAALAINGINTGIGSDYAIMGFVTAISTSGVFNPGTTLLDATTVTDTYTDGNPANRNRPCAACYFGGLLYVRPRSDDIYQLRYPARTRPSAFADDNAVPGDVKWGPAIAAGAALAYLLAKEGDSTRSQEISEVLQYRLRSIKSKKRIMRQGRYTTPSF